MTRRLSLFAAFALTLTMVVGTGAAAAAGPFPARIDLPDGWMPEGITSGPGTTFYAGSLANGAIWRGNLRTGAGSVLVPGAAGHVAVGMDYQAGAKRLWVAGGPTGAVCVYDARSGAPLATYQFAAGFLNDLVVTPDAVYATDSFVQQLAVIPLGPGGALPAPGAAFVRPLSGDIAYVAGQLNANGIVATRGWLVLVQSNTGRLFRVDPFTGQTAAIDLGGYSVTAGDGLELHGDTLYVVRNQLRLVAVLRLDGGLGSATLLGELTSPDLDVPTTATFAAGRLWAVNARFGTPNPRRPTTG